jgi:hypothetical protein
MRSITSASSNWSVPSSCFDRVYEITCNLAQEGRSNLLFVLVAPCAVDALPALAVSPSLAQLFSSEAALARER